MGVFRRDNYCTHTFVWSNVLPSLAWEASHEQGATDIGHAGTGLIFGSSTISSTLEGVVKVSGDWVAKTLDADTAAATAAVVNAGRTIGGFESSMSIGGSTVGYTQSWDMTMNANSKILHGQGSRVPLDGSSHLRSVSFKAKVAFENTTQLARVLGSASAITATEPATYAVTLAADNGTALGSGKRALTMNLTGCQMKYSLTAQKNDFVMYTLDGMGILSSGTAVDQVLEAAW